MQAAPTTPEPTVGRFVADLGNTPLKWARVRPDGRLVEQGSVPVDALDSWTVDRVVEAGSSWTIATVNPPFAEVLASWLAATPVGRVHWLRSAAGVPGLQHVLERPEATGVDRALAVSAALELRGGRGPGVVVSCGTGITVESVSEDGVWLGGAIAAGLQASARGLSTQTAQLPLVSFTAMRPATTPPALGRSTEPALMAGLFWGAAGAVRMLVERQCAELTVPPWVVLTGGDAAILAPWIGPDVEVVEDLVLLGLAGLAVEVAT